MFITCVPVCSFHAAACVFSTPGSSNWHEKSKHFQGRVNAWGSRLWSKNLQTYPYTLHTKSTANQKSLEYHKNNTWLLLLCTQLIVYYILKKRNPEAGSLASSLTYPRNTVLHRSLHYCPTFFWYQKIILPVLYISFLFILSSNQWSNSCFLK